MDWQTLIGLALVAMIGYPIYSRYREGRGDMKRSGTARNEAFGSTSEYPIFREANGKRPRLTDLQTNCLHEAERGTVIYGETPSFVTAQMPKGSVCYPLKTVQSLEKRGYLRTDGRGGYAITEDGKAALWSSMGF